eukprot:m.70021 g.70021  ORF g.70021 m.70021 type:complete len:427 (+) comp12102_c0_seq3:338-1618(+)
MAIRLRACTNLYGRALCNYGDSHGGLFRSKFMGWNGLYRPRQLEQSRGINFYDRRTSIKAAMDVEPYTILTLRNKHTTEEELIDSCRFVHNQLLVRIAKRIEKIHELPFIAAMNPNLQAIYARYVEVFNRLVASQNIVTLEDEMRVTAQLSDILIESKTILPMLASASQDLSLVVSKDHLTSFVDTMIQGRVSRRLLVASHLHSHTMFFENREYESDDLIIDDLDLAVCCKDAFQAAMAIVKHHYGAAPDLKLDEDSVKLCYVPSILRYSFFELFKNAGRAVVMEQKKRGKENLPPIEVYLYPTAHGITIRIIDEGGGKPDNLEGEGKQYDFTTTSKGQQYAFTTVKKDEISVPFNLHSAAPFANDLELRTTIGEGFGLPLVRVFAEYFSGKINIQTRDGFGTDVYLRLKNLNDEVVIQQLIDQPH